MAGSRDIQAGRAAVTLGLNNSAFVKGLKSSSKMLKDWGKSTAIVGATISAAGAAILAPLTAITNQLLDTGDAFDKMRQRTGLSVEAISELDHAAGQSATSLETVEGAIMKMQKGLIANSKAFAKLGLNLEQLKKLSPEDQFSATAAAVNKISDPTKKAAAAMSVFGKSGTQLLPMLEDLDALRQEARDMGFVMSGETAGAAVKLGDMFANLLKTIQWTGMSVAEVLLPSLTSGVEIMQRVVSVVAKWIRDNRQMVTVIAAVGAGLVAAGAAITAFGGAMAAAGVVLGGIASALSAVGAAIGVVLSPVGLITAALVGGVAAWLAWTESGQAAVQTIMGIVGPMLDTFKQTFQGVMDALMGGDFALAGKIAMTGLQVALLQGVSAIANSVGGAFGDFLGTIGSQLIEGDLSGAWSTMVSGMSAMWSGFAESIVSVFTTSARAVVGIWEKMSSFIAAKLLEFQGFFEAMIDITGGAVGRAILGDNFLSGGVDMKAEQARRDKLNAALRAKGLNAGGDDVLAEAQQNARGQIGGQADAARSMLSNIDAAMQAKTREAMDRLAQRTAGGASGLDSDIASLLAELDQLTAAASELRNRDDAEVKDQSKRVANAATGDASMSSVAGTFSAAAATAMGNTRSPVDESNKILNRQEKLMMRQEKQLDGIKRAVEQGGTFI